jgi:hypothetical protein
MQIGFLMSGSEANSFTSKPGGATWWRIDSSADTGFWT